MIVQKGKNITADLISADDIEKKWPKWDVLLCLSGKPAYNQAAESGKVLAGEAGLLFQGVADRL